jgi:hypothetical protein
MKDETGRACSMNGEKIHVGYWWEARWVSEQVKSFRALDPSATVNSHVVYCKQKQ